MGWTLQESEQTECYYTYSLHGFAGAEWIEKSTWSETWVLRGQCGKNMGEKKNFGTNNGNGDNIREITRADEALLR
jgi:hypothetical protein